MRQGLTKRELMLGSAACGVGLALAGPAQAAAELQKVNIVSTSGGTNVVLATLIRQQGYLKEFGVDATFVNAGDGPKLMGALVSGQMDICPMSGFGQVFAAVEKGAKVKILAGGAILPLQGLMSAKPDIKRVEDLVGKTVGTSSLGSLNNQLTVATLKKFGVDVSKVNFVNIGSATDIFRAIVAGTVDAGSTDVWMDGSNGIHTLEHGRFWIDLPEYTYQAAFTAQSTIDSKRDVLVRTLAAYAKLYRFIQDPGSADAFVSAFAGGMGNDDRSAAMLQWNFYQKYKPFDVDLVLSPQRLDYMQDRNLESGVQTRRVSFDDVADMSLAQDAIKLLK